MTQPCHHPVTLQAGVIQNPMPFPHNPWQGVLWLPSEEGGGTGTFSGNIHIGTVPSVPSHLVNNEGENNFPGILKVLLHNNFPLICCFFVRFFLVILDVSSSGRI